MSTAALVPVFAALGDETRWSILAALGEGDASASALAGRLPISRQAIAKHLVEGHGGRVRAESTVGRGTTIWAELPDPPAVTST